MPLCFWSLGITASVRGIGVWDLQLYLKKFRFRDVDGEFPSTGRIDSASVIVFLSSGLDM